MGTQSGIAMVLLGTLLGACGSSGEGAAGSSGSTSTAAGTSDTTGGDSGTSGGDSGADRGERSVDVDGAAVVYDDIGAGDPAVVLVHGGASHSGVWEAVAPTLGQTHRVISIDLPGHGRSDPRDGYVPADFEAAIVGVLDDAAVDSAVLVGHSFGVSVVRDVAFEHPQRVRALVMLDGYLVPLIADEALRTATLDALASDQWQATAQTIVEQFMFGANTSAEIKTFVLDMMLTAAQPTWIGVFTIAVDPAIERDDPSAIAVRGIFTSSASLPAGYEQYLRDRFANLEYTLEPEGTGHFVQLERPAELIAQIEAFVGGLI